jgi:hypothetical protein
MYSKLQNEKIVVKITLRVVSNITYRMKPRLVQDQEDELSLIDKAPTTGQ